MKPGKSHFSWHAGGDFFKQSGSSEIFDADIQVEADVNCLGTSVSVSCTVEGSVTVQCDRCLEDLVIPVSTSFEDENVFDLRQDVYDFVCISLPLQKVHPEGGCNEATISYLSKQ